MKLVLFDLYGTLITLGADRDNVQMRAAEKFGLSLSREGIQRGYNAADMLMAEQNRIKALRLLSEEESDRFFIRYQQAVLGGDGHIVPDETALQIWRVVKAAGSQFVPFDDAIEGLSEVRKLGLRIGILSNMSVPGKKLEEQFSFAGIKVLEFVLTSSDVGYEKPHPRVFEAALERADVTARDAVYVGDQIVSDVEGALAAKIQPILLDRFNAHPNFNSQPRVKSMSELVHLLDSMLAVN